MTPEISIIIPVYNGEKYLEQCLNSICEQTYSDFEVIIINDGSTDGSQKILNSFQKKDTRFYSYQISNSGVSKARNIGLAKATGKWITFVDCDDWLERNYLEVLHSKTSETVDIVMANFFFNKEGSLQYSACCSKSTIHKSEFPAYPFAMMVEDCAAWNKLRISVEILCAACNKLTRRQLITSNGIQFNENLKLNEDGLFHLTCFLKAKDVLIIDIPLYHYRMLQSSSNNRFRPDVNQQMIIWKRSFADTISSFSKHDKDIFLSLSAYRQYLNLVSLYVNNVANKQSFLSKAWSLASFLKDDIYDVSVVPNSLKWFKKVEMFLLKNKCCILLLCLSNFRKRFKK